MILRMHIISYGKILNKITKWKGELDECDAEILISEQRINEKIKRFYYKENPFVFFNFLPYTRDLN